MCVSELIDSSVNIVLSSARPSFLEVSLLDSFLKIIGIFWLTIGSVLSLGIGVTPGSSSILKINICIQKLKVFGEIVSPCGQPLSRLKFREQRPSSRRTQAVLLLPIRASHFLMLGPKLKNRSTLSRKLLDSVSKALAISTAMTAPSMFLCLHILMVSHTFISTSWVKHDLLKPFWDRLHILLTTLSSLAFRALDRILYRLDSKEKVSSSYRRFIRALTLIQ